MLGPWMQTDVDQTECELGPGRTKLPHVALLRGRYFKYFSANNRWV